MEDLDKILGDSTHTNRYVIVYKNIFSWLPSIEKWAKKCKWEINSKMDFIEDYLNFIKKWYSIKNSRVIFINYEEYLNVLNDNNLLLEKLSKFFNKNPNKIKLSITKVEQSGIFTNDNKRYYINKEYMNLYSEEELDKIQNNWIYKEIVDYDIPF